jgi:UDP-glucose 4-epimerase
MDVHGVYTELLVRWIERIANGKSPIIFGDGSQTMDLVHVQDIARANILAATSDVTDEVFNIGSGVETSLTDLAEKLLEVMGSDLPVQFGPERAVNKVTRRLADTGRARERLGFAAEIELEDGLAGLVQWWRAERENPSSAAIAAASC